MFRYIALAWEPASPDAAAMAQAMAQGLSGHPEWTLELARQGYSIFSTGAAPGINQAYRLGNDRGVVLGRLFHRHERTAGTDRINALIASSNTVVASEGRELTSSYWGRYVAFIESGDGGLSVLRDPSGVLPCFMLRQAGVTVVFSWLEDVLNLLPQIPVPRVDHEALAAHMAFGELSGPRCALEGVTQVLAGQRVRLGEAGPRSDEDENEDEFVWSAAGMAQNPLALSPAEAIAALQETVDSCVRAWASCYEAALLRLSGGVDSSIVVSCLSPSRTRSQVTCLNYHSTGPDSDEREFARQAAAMAGRKLIELERDSTMRLEQLLENAARTPAPMDYVGRLGSASDAEVACAVGAPVVFSGSGGDQLFFEVRQWWPAADYLRQRGIDAGFPGAAMDAARLGAVSVWAAIRHAVADRWRRLPPALDRYKHFALLSASVQDQASRPAGFVHPVLYQPTTLPIGKLMQVQQLTHAPGYYNPYLRERAPETIAPLLSQPLVELCLKLPTFLLVHGGRGRGLVRSAFEREIPAAIAHRRSKGGNDEHVRSVLANNLELAKQMLLDGELVRLGLIDRAATASALSGQTARKTVHAGEIHVCLGIEAWLQRWRPQARRAP